MNRQSKIGNRKSPSHRGFAWFWDWAVRHEDRREREMRRYVAGGASGRVLEIGLGVGTNWDYLPNGVDYVGIEPDPYMLRRARRHASASGRDHTIVSARAELLPFPDASFDTVVTTLTFCSVQRPRIALDEVRRLLRTDGQFRFFEHVRPSGRVRGRIFDAITPGWKRIGGGCHPNRRTTEAIESAGFTITGRRTFSRAGIPMVAGVAVRH